MTDDVKITNESIEGSEDYQTLMAIREMTEAEIAQAHVEGKDYDLSVQASKFIDPQSLSYFAMRHAAGVLGYSTSFQVNQHREEVMREASTFVQGFLFGMRFQQIKTPIQRRTSRQNARSGNPSKRAQA